MSAEKFSSFATGVASGTAKALLNLFNNAAAPTRRGGIYDILIGSVATPADQAALFSLNRTTAQGTAAASYTPNNLDGSGPAGEYAAGQGAFSGEPTKTANKELLTFPLNQRATFRWVANQGGYIFGPATQNAGACLQTKSSTSTQAGDCTVLHEE